MEKMIFMILLLIILTSCVCAATLVVNVPQTSYQAEENHDITLDWTFSPKDERPSIYCDVFTKVKPMILYHVYEGDELPENQDEQFTGRVQCDKDALREGRITLHMSRLRTEDSGWYVCVVLTRDGRGVGECYLNVTAGRDQPEPEPGPGPGPGPDPVSRGRISLYCGLGLTAAAGSVLFILFQLLKHRPQQLDQRKQFDLIFNEPETQMDLQTSRTLRPADKTVASHPGHRLRESWSIRTKTTKPVPSPLQWTSSTGTRIHRLHL